MSSGLYGAVSQAQAQQQNLQLIANNLANVNTVGFKKDSGIFSSLLEQAAGRPAGSEFNQVRLEKTFLDLSQGAVKNTGRELDAAIIGPGFFRIETPEGNLYTRQGNFSVSEDGRLVTASGNPVLGENGPISLAGATEIIISGDGTVRTGQEILDRLALFSFPEGTPLVKRGDGLLEAADGTAPGRVNSPRIEQGALEMSNVNSIEEMARMIESLRSFESCQKVIKNYGEIASKVNNLGKL